MRSKEAMIWVRVKQRNISTSLPPVHVSSHLRVMGGMINDTSHGSEGEVWRVGAYLWSHHRHDHRLCKGGMDHLGHDHKDERRVGLGSAGGDLRRPIYEATEPARETARIRESR